MSENGCGLLDAKSESSLASFLFSRKETLVVALSPFWPFLAATPRSPPSLLAYFLGETLGKDGILFPPCNYVLLEVVDHGD
jgi:hypothetical protein